MYTGSTVLGECGYTQYISLTEKDCYHSSFKGRIRHHYVPFVKIITTLLLESSKAPQIPVHVMYKGVDRNSTSANHVVTIEMVIMRIDVH